jgi:hypothetical protein
VDGEQRQPKDVVREFLTHKMILIDR